jgi:hypothetical protein
MDAMLVVDMEDKVMAMDGCRAVVAAHQRTEMDSPKAEAILYHPFWGTVVVPNERSTGDLQEFLLHTVHPQLRPEDIIPWEDTVFLQAHPGCIQGRLMSSHRTPT